MKVLFIKILCWVAGIGAVGYVGLTIVKSIPSLSPLVGAVPFVGKIPTPVIEPLAEATYDCSWTYAKTEPVRISDAPESEGSYPRWECVAKNPDKSEEEYQKYLTELDKYKEWPRDPNYNIDTYRQAECEYYGGLKYGLESGFESGEFYCIIPLRFQTASNGDEMYQNALRGFEYYKSIQHADNIKIIDYSKE